jgi:hypothetical protein
MNIPIRRYHTCFCRFFRFSLSEATTAIERHAPGYPVDFRDKQLLRDNTAILMANRGIDTSRRKSNAARSMRPEVRRRILSSAIE